MKRLGKHCSGERPVWRKTVHGKREPMTDEGLGMRVQCKLVKEFQKARAWNLLATLSSCPGLWLLQIRLAGFRLTLGRIGKELKPNSKDCRGGLGFVCFLVFVLFVCVCVCVLVFSLAYGDISHLNVNCYYFISNTSFCSVPLQPIKQSRPVEVLLLLLFQRRLLKR